MWPEALTSDPLMVMTWRVKTVAVLTAILPLLALIGESPAPRPDNTANLVIVVAVLILSFGLWRRRRWAWWLGVAFAGLWLLALAGAATMISRLAGYVEILDLTDYYAFLALQAVLTVALTSLLLAPATRRDFFRPPVPLPPD